MSGLGCCASFVAFLASAAASARRVWLRRPLLWRSAGPPHGLLRGIRRRRRWRLEGNLGWRGRGWRQGKDAALLDGDVSLAGGDADERASAADSAVECLLLHAAVRDFDLVEFALDVAVVGVELVGEGGVFGDGDGDGAVAVFDGDAGERRCAGDVDRAVAVGDEDVAGDAVESDVAAVGGEGDGAYGVAGVELGVVADFDVTVEAGELEVGAAGVEAEGAADVLAVGVAEEVSADGDGAGEVGEGGVVGPAFEVDLAGDGVGGEVVITIVDAALTSPVMAESSTSPWLAVTRTGPLMELILMSP